MNGIQKKIKQLCFRLKLRFLDWEFYTFNPLSKGLRYPPSFHLLHTPEEQLDIKEQDMARCREQLRLLMETAEKNASGQRPGD